MNDKSMDNASNKSIEERTPLSVIMDMAKNEIGNFSLNLMQSNNIPSFLMCYIMKSVLCDIQQIALEKLSDEFAKLQKKIKGSGEGNGD